MVGANLTKNNNKDWPVLGGDGSAGNVHIKSTENLRRNAEPAGRPACGGGGGRGYDGSKPGFLLTLDCRAGLVFIHLGLLPARSR